MKPIVRVYAILVLVVVALVFQSVLIHGKRQRKVIYEFVQSWAPDLCTGTNSALLHSCSNPQEFWKKNFVIHGLWPAYTKNGYPKACESLHEFEGNVIESVGREELLKYWPDATESTNNYDQFWENEWQKHGACTELSPAMYFKMAIALAQTVETSEVITNSADGYVSTEVLKASFGGPEYVSLKCDSAGRLIHLSTCWDQSEGIPKNRIACPNHVLSQANCHTSKIAVQSNGLNPEL